MKTKTKKSAAAPNKPIVRTFYKGSPIFTSILHIGRDAGYSWAAYLEEGALPEWVIPEGWYMGWGDDADLGEHEGYCDTSHQAKAAAQAAATKLHVKFQKLLKKVATRELTWMGRDHEKATSEIRKYTETHSGVRLGRFDHHSNRLGD